MELGQGKGHFFWFDRDRERRAKGFLPRTKVRRIDEGYAWVPRKKDFAKDLRKEILGD